MFVKNLIKPVPLQLFSMKKSRHDRIEEKQKSSLSLKKSSLEVAFLKIHSRPEFH